MRLFAVLLIATLLAGCTSTAKKNDFLPISKSNWQQLEIALREAPIELRRAISQAGDDRGTHQQAKLPNANAPQNAQVVLLDILTHTQIRFLLPDSEFERLIEAVVGFDPSPSQSYAAALTGYLLQPDFGCHQPVYASYFQRRYAASNTKPCTTDVPFTVLTRFEGAKVVWINPKRIKSIHLLFASKSESMASRFGHVALRLVVCPDAETSSAVCDANLLEHIVLGFQAHIDELSLDTIKALNGEYKAYLFANRFLDVYEEYAIGEFRNVYSLPLRLDDAQRELMVRELADIHWRYAGNYSFFTKNCATMLQNALRVSWADFSANTKLKGDFLRPDSLFEVIKSSSLAEGNMLSSLDLAEQSGYYFSSTRQFYSQALAEVRDRMSQPKFADIEGYLRINPVERRFARKKDKQFSDHLATDKHLREAQIMLEEYAVLRSGRAMMIEAARYFEELNLLQNADTVLLNLDAEQAKVFNDCLLAPIRQHAAPIKRSGGIPSPAETLSVTFQASNCQTIRSKKLLYEGISKFRNSKSEVWQKLNEISQYWVESMTNLNLLKQM